MTSNTITEHTKLLHSIRKLMKYDDGEDCMKVLNSIAYILDQIEQGKIHMIHFCNRDLQHKRLKISVDYEYND